MNVLRKTVALSTVSLVLCSGLAFAQDRHDDNHRDEHSNYVRHDDWRKGGHISHDDWNRGRPVDYRQYHLSAPPRGYEWREVDGNYVLAAVASGVIASAIIASTAH